jgi:hypothetical protein
MREWIIWAGVIAVFLLCYYRSTRPIVFEIGQATEMNIDDAWTVRYEYSINGVPHAVFFRDDEELQRYRAYLKRIGRFYD